MVTSGPGATNTVTPVRDCMADSIPMVVICGQVPTAPSAPTPSRRRRSPRSWARSPSMCSWSPTPTKLEGTVRTAFEIARTRPARAGGGRHPQGRAELAGHVPGHGTCCRDPGLPQAHRELAARRVSRTQLAALLRCWASEATADLCRRRRHQCRARRRAARVLAAAFGIPVVTTLMGIGAFDTTHPLSCACSACTVRPSPTTRSRTAIS
jgi:acetolactate synthase-1/2/3 large subunit